MIRLRNLLFEITLGSVPPYATQFVWQRVDGLARESTVNCDGVEVVFHMQPEHEKTREYIFAIALPDVSGGHTVTHDKSAAVGQLSYIRLMATAAEAILDFCTQYAPESVDVTGFDSDPDKDLQKTRIYRGLMAANATRIATAGYQTLARDGKLWLVRKFTSNESV